MDIIGGYSRSWKFSKQNQILSSPKRTMCSNVTWSPSLFLTAHSKQFQYLWKNIHTYYAGTTSTTAKKFELRGKLNAKLCYLINFYVLIKCSNQFLLFKLFSGKSHFYWVEQHNIKLNLPIPKKYNEHSANKLAN